MPQSLIWLSYVGQPRADLEKSRNCIAYRQRNMEAKKSVGAEQLIRIKNNADWALSAGHAVTAWQIKREML